MALQWNGWTARVERREERLSPEPLARLAATFDHHGAHWPAGAVPPLAHWLYFLPEARTDALGADGHPRHGGLLPPIAAPRRMWAGGRVTFHRPLLVGAVATRDSEVIAVARKDGRSGPLHFVTVQHAIAQDGHVTITEEQDLVFREEETAGAPAPAAVPDARIPAATRTIVPDERMLFRFSALTFNTHRIHYDRGFAQAAEGYPDLVVHGPMQAMLLADLLLRERPGAAIASFSYRGRRPAFAGRALTLCLAAGGPAELWTRDTDGAACMTATATLG